MGRNDRLVDSITVDLDYVEPMDILKSWSTLRRMGADRIQGRLSSSGGGVHIEATGVPDDYHHRRIAGDDGNRIGKDIEKGWRPSGVLFESPYPWVDCPFNLIDQLQTEVTL